MFMNNPLLRYMDQKEVKVRNLSQFLEKLLQHSTFIHMNAFRLQGVQKVHQIPDCQLNVERILQ